MRCYPTVLIILVFPLAAHAADGAQVLDCIKRVKTASWSSQSMREIFAAVACMGVSPPVESAEPKPVSLQLGGERKRFGPGSAEVDFGRRVGIIHDCFDKVAFRVQARGPDAENIAATACVGALDAEETASCVEQVSRKYDHSKGPAAELLAAQACARGNPAAETTVCVSYVSFRLDSTDVLSEILATIACSR